MATEYVGPRTWSMVRDADGNREYKLRSLVRGAITDGPATVLQTAGLPQVGDEWNFFGDHDPWATCKQTAKVDPHPNVKEGSPFAEWIVEQTFSSKGDAKACKDQQIDDPLLQPMKISGSFKNTNREATHDRHGQPIVNSAWEQLRGPQVEFPISNPLVTIEQNVAVLELGLCSRMVNHVNQAELWGVSRRNILLTQFTWEKKFYGKCQAYYQRKFEFEISDIWDRDLLDEGTKALHGHWDHDTGNYLTDKINGADPDPTNPQHFDRFKDRNGENARVILDGGGLPADVVVGLHMGTGNLFLSITDDNTGNPLDDPDNWIQIRNDIVNAFPDWQVDGEYFYGDIVSLPPAGGEPRLLFIATDDPYTGEPPTLHGGNWHELPGSSIADSGNYDASTTYDEGDYVHDTTPKTEAGNIHLEYFPEADFTRLGIPLIL